MRNKTTYRPRGARTVAAALMPPNLQSMGAVPFTGENFTELDAWLAEEGWPHERMDVAMLEGYLVALLVWPMEISAGAWLPSTWGIRGWKVAEKIAEAETYDRFLKLVVGFLQELERRLTASPRLPPLVLELKCHVPILSARYFAGSAWATGFMVALHENSASFGSRSLRSRSAVEAIARFASLRSMKPSAMRSAAIELTAAVAILMEDRPSRGVLGPLPIGLSGTAQVGQRRRAAPRKVDYPIAVP